MQIAQTGAFGPSGHSTAGPTGPSFTRLSCWRRMTDTSGSKNRRGYVERSRIGLLSDFDREPCDPPSPDWLGLDCTRPKVRRSGIWNQQHVEDPYEPAFLDVLDRLVDEDP